MTHPMVRIVAVFALFLSLSLGVALADGKISGHVSSLDGAALADINILVLPEQKEMSRLSGKSNKKGDYFFGFVKNGKYTLNAEDPQGKLAPHKVKVLIYDTEKHKEVLNYQGDVPETPIVFDVDMPLKVTYDLTLGPADQTPAAIAKRRSESQAILQEVDGLIQTGDYAGAVAKLDERLRTEPDDSKLLALPEKDPARQHKATLFYSRASALVKKGDLEQALDSVSHALALDPSLAWAHFVTGAILAQQGKKSEAIPHFEKELADNTDKTAQINSLLNIGRIHSDLAQDEGGRSRAETQAGHADTARAASEAQQKHRNSAVGAFEKVLELDPSQSEAYTSLDELYLAMGQEDKARGLEEKKKSLGIQDNPDDAKVAFNTGANLWNGKEYAKAEGYFRRATEIDPKFALAWKSLGYALVKSGKYPEACAALRKALELDPQAGDANDLKSTIDALCKN